MLSIKKLLVKMLTPETHSFIMPSTVAFSGFRITRVGALVNISASNVTKAATGSNAICTLPAGWRPTVAQAVVLVGPNGSTPNANNLSLRLTVQPSGEVAVYNYRSSAIYGNTNQSGSLTYIAEQ